MAIRTVHSNNGIKLDYPNKVNKDDILKLTRPAELKEKFKSSRSSSDFVNLLIHADNLRALKSLYENKKIRGRVRLVYIDPPFATGRLFNGATIKKVPLTRHDVAYDDSLQGSEYIEFLRERLLFLREILADDGSIYVHIDWKMAHYVRVIMDEVFGPEHFVNDITRIKCNPKGMPRSGYGNYKDTILFYSKGDDFLWNDSREPFTEEEINRLFLRKDENGKKYTTFPLHASNEVKEGSTGKPWRGRLPPKGAHWQYVQEELDRMERKGLIVWSPTGNPRRKVYADDAIARGKKRQDIWEFKDPPYPSYPTEKNLDMLKVIIESSSNKGDIVLDAFCGSGSTLVAAEELRRHWIGIDNSPLAVRIAQKRLAGIGDLEPYSLYVDNGKIESLNALYIGFKIAKAHRETLGEVVHS
jgi:adenine-specific DNA-methyltransferase